MMDIELRNGPWRSLGLLVIQIVEILFMLNSSEFWDQLCGMWVMSHEDQKPTSGSLSSDT